MVYLIGIIFFILFESERRKEPDLNLKKKYLERGIWDFKIEKT